MFKKSYSSILGLSLLFFASGALAEVIKLKCSGRNEYSGKMLLNVYQINTSSGTVNNQRYAILDVTEKMITWQKSIADNPGDQLPLVEINRLTGVMLLTWPSGDTSTSTSCVEF